MCRLWRSACSASCCPFTFQVHTACLYHYRKPCLPTVALPVPQSYIKDAASGVSQTHVGFQGASSTDSYFAGPVSRSRGGAGAGGAAAAQQPASGAGVLRLPGGPAGAGCRGVSRRSCTRCAATPFLVPECNPGCTSGPLSVAGPCLTCSDRLFKCWQHACAVPAAMCRPPCVTGAGRRFRGAGGPDCADGGCAAGAPDDVVAWHFQRPKGQGEAGPPSRSRQTPDDRQRGCTRGC